MGGASYPPPPQPGYQTVGANAFGQSGVSSVQKLIIRVMEKLRIAGNFRGRKLSRMAEKSRNS